MCGLIGFLSKDEEKIPAERAKNYVIDQFQDQVSRGVKGFGLVQVKDNGFTSVLRATTEAKMLVDAYHVRAKHVFLHHRSPTSSENYLDQTHPIEVEHEELKYIWLVMHNGTIHNADSLKKKHEEMGYVYLTEHKVQYTNYTAQKFNDSESLAIEVARFLEGIGENGKSPMMHTRGGFAFIAIAMDRMSQIQKVYLGTNGYGGINLASTGSSYYFASEEKTGTAIEKDTCWQFDAKYMTKIVDAKVEMHLKGFEMVKEPIKIEYEPEAAPAPVKSPWSKEFAGRSRAGFGQHGQSPKAGGGAKKDTDEDEKGNVHFSSYAHLVAYVQRSKLGEVFQDTSKVVHTAIEEFDREAFDKLISEGNPDEAEEMFNTYIEGIPEWLDFDELLGETLEPVAANIPKDPSTNDVVEGFKDVAKRRMSTIAKDYMPLFWLCSYCECVIHLAYQYQADLTERERHAREEKIIADIDAGGSVADIKSNDAVIAEIERKKREDPDGFGAEIDKLWPDKKPEDILPAIRRRQAIARNLGKDDERTSTGGEAHGTWDYNGVEYDSYEAYKAAHPDDFGDEEPPVGIPIVQKHLELPEKVEATVIPYSGSNRTDDMDTDAGAMLSALGESATSMTPDEIYREAGEVAEAIVSASEVGVMEQLSMATALAVEEGMVMKIPFHFDKVKDIMDRTRRRLETLAHIVKATHIKESTDEFYAGGRPYMNG